MGAAETAAAAAHEVAAPAQTAASEETVSSKVNAAAAAPKSKAHAAATLRQGREKARGCSESHREEDGRSRAKAHSPSKKSSGRFGQDERGPEGQSAPGRKAKRSSR